MALQNFVDKQGVVSAAWLNAVDALLDTVFGSTATKVAARAALTSDLPMEVANGGTGVRTLAALASALNSYFSIGGPQTAAEILAGVTPTNTLYSVGDVRRYGAVKDGSTPCAAAFQQAALVAAAGGNYGKIFVPADTPSNSPNATYGYCYLMTGGSGTNTLVLPAGCTLYGEGAGSRLKWTTDFINGIVTANDVTVDGIAVEGPQSNDNGPSYSYLLTNGIYGYQKRNVTIRNCIVSKWHFAGIHLNSCANYRIEGNVLHSQVRPVFGSSDNSTSDIVVYGTALPAWGYIGKGLIHGNFCYSDSNVAISIDPLGYDADIIVSNNIVVPLDTIYSANNWTEIPVASVWRRYGILVTYQGGGISFGGRVLVEGNFVKNINSAGIIRESAAAIPKAPCSVVGNYVAYCGYSGGRTFPQNGNPNSFGFGIFFNQSNSAGDSVVGNVVVYTQALGDTSRAGANLTFQSGGIVVASVSKANAGSMLISGNTSSYNTTHGIAIMFSATQTKVIGNYMHSNNDADITLYITDAAAGDVHIESNTCIRTDGTLSNCSPCMALWGTSAGSGRISVKRNTLMSIDYTVPASKTSGTWLGNANAGNSGIVMAIQPSQRFSITHNDFHNLYNGIYLACAIPSGRTVLNWSMHFNNIRSCTNGINVPYGGTSQWDCIVAVGNMFENCTNMQMPVYNSGNLYLASIWRGGLVEIISGGALPTYGTWLLGDHIFNGSPIPGGNFGWVCTGPGQANVCTWKTYGAIQA